MDRFQATSISPRDRLYPAEFIEVVITGDFICWRQWRVILPGGRLAELQRFSCGAADDRSFKPANRSACAAENCSCADAISTPADAS
ncbi:hypothetical protein DMI65_10835 [Escherichia coli]|nr:hypothetical protein [Escherichia coli]